jgi:transposase
MDRETLLALDKEALVELVLRLLERVAALEAELAQRRQPPKNPGNSSVPPSAGQKPNRAERRRAQRGARRGHPGTSRFRAQPDLRVACRPERCRGCQAQLPPEGQRVVARRQVVELPVVRALVLELRQYRADCANCGTRTVAELPPGFRPGATFGPRVEALLAYLHEGQHIGYARLAALCQDLFGLRISEGAIEAALARVANAGKPEGARIREQVRASPVINSDETGARVNGTGWYHWVFQTPTASYHVLAPTRARRVIDEFLAGARPEAWGSDAYAAQLGAPAEAHQLCLSHQIRDLTYVEEADGPAGQGWARQLRHVFGRGIRLHRQRGTISAEQFANRRTRVLKAAERLIVGPPLGVGEGWKLQRRYRKHWDSLFVFLQRDDVEPTNNSSEQDLRPAVVHRKVTGGYRSEAGAERGAIYATLLATARKTGQNVFELFCRLTGPSPLAAAGLPS